MTRAAVLRYGLTVIGVCGAVGATWVLVPPTGIRFGFFYLAVMLIAWLGGARAGLLALALASTAAAYLFITPAFSVALGPIGLLQLAVMPPFCLVIIWVVSQKDRALAQLRLLNTQLEQRVGERTAELEQKTA